MNHMTDVFHNDINKISETNTYFRRVLSTTPNMQLVAMSLKPLEDIGIETHPYTTQFIRVEKGEGIAVINNINYELFDDVAIIIPLGTEHNIINTSCYKSLKLYTIYSPPHHPMNKIDIVKPLD